MTVRSVAQPVRMRSLCAESPIGYLRNCASRYAILRSRCAEGKTTHYRERSPRLETRERVPIRLWAAEGLVTSASTRRVRTGQEHPSRPLPEQVRHIGESLSLQQRATAGATPGGVRKGTVDRWGPHIIPQKIRAVRAVSEAT